MKLVVFDLDGTLLNTIVDLTNAMNVGLVAGNLPTITPQELRDMVGNGTGRMAARACGQSSGQLYDTVSKHYAMHYLQHFTDNTHPYDGVIEVLDYLASRGVAVGVFSDKVDSAVKQLCSMHFGSRVQWAIGKYNDILSKPNTYGLVEIMDNCGADRSNTVFVGDSTVDIATARNGGVPCVCVDWGYNDHAKLVECGATTIASTAQQLLDILSNM